MAARERRQRKHVERLGNYADDEALDELHLESDSEEEGSDVEEARGAVAKAARRGGGGRAAPRHTAVTADMLSTLLAGAPALVDCLLLEDSVRSITLCCRNVVNVNIAAGGGVNLEPVWQALASRVKAKAAAAAAAAAEQAAGGTTVLGQPVNLEAGAAPAAPAPAAAVAPAAHEPGPEPEPAGRRTRRGRAKKAKPPPEPSALDVVKAAVAADPARSADVRKTTAPWVYKISQKSLAELPTHKGQYGKTLYCYELDVRTIAWRRWGDQARMEAAKHRAEEQEQQRREQYDRRRQEEKEARQEEVAISLEAESLQFFKRDWRYRCFIASGEADGLEALLGTARRQLAARHAEGERHRELAERLDAAGLEFYHSTSPMFAEWLKTGEGDIGAIVQQRRLRVDRECQLQYLLEMNGLLHRQNSERCKKFVTGELLHRSGQPYSAKEVVASLLASLGNEHTRCQELLDRLREERLPPVMHLSWCQTYVTAGGDLDAVIYQVKEYVYGRADVGVPPPGRPWVAADNSTDARIGAHATKEEPPASLPVTLRLLHNGQALPIYKQACPAGFFRVTHVYDLPPGSTVDGLQLQLLDESGRPATAVVAGKLSWNHAQMNVTWDAPVAADGAGSGISLPPIQAPEVTGGIYRKEVRFVSSKPPLELSLALTFEAGAGQPPLLPLPAPVQPSEPEAMTAAEGVGETGEPSVAAAAAAPAAAEAPGAETGAAAVEAEAEKVASGQQEQSGGTETAAGADSGAEPGGAAEHAGEQGATSPPAAAAVAAEEEEAAAAAEAAPESTADEMAVEAAGEQPAAGGETPFFSAEEAVAATAAKASQQQAEQAQEQAEQAQEQQEQGGPVEPMQE